MEHPSSQYYSGALFCTLHLSGQSPLVSLVPPPSQSTTLTSSCPFHSHAQLIWFYFYPPFFSFFFLFFVCDMRHTFKCQLPAAANGFLLPARSAVPLSFSGSCCLSLGRFSLFYFQYATHTPRPRSLQLQHHFFCFFSKLASITGGRRCCAGPGG